MLLKTLILGLGNPILGDDGVGWRVVEMLGEYNAEEAESNRALQTPYESVEFDCAALCGLSLMERLIGYHRVLLIDALNIPEQPVGAVIQSNLKEISNPLSGRLSSAHDTTLETALKIGQQLGAPLPKEICIIGINTTFCFEFSETLSSTVAAAIPKAVQQASDWLYKSTTQLEKTLPDLQAN